jgi:hypothetical protein
MRVLPERLAERLDVLDLHLHHTQFLSLIGLHVPRAVLLLQPVGFCARLLI